MAMEETSADADQRLGVVEDPSIPTEQTLPVFHPPEFNPGSADDTRSSVSSDKSDSKPPRSAMRRTSSVPKIPQSPRRVRFDFMGEEVLPTTSPQPSAFISARIPSPDPIGDETNCASHLATERGEEEEDEPAPFRKVSSSDALRALSRTPLEEDGTVWTVVNSEPNESASDQILSSQDEEAEISLLSSSTTATMITNDSIPTSTLLAAEPDPKHESDIVGDMKRGSLICQEDSSEDEFLDMGKPKLPATSESRAHTLLSPTKLTQRTTAAQSALKNTTSPKKVATETNGRGLGWRESASTVDESEMFHFEEDGLQLPERPRQAQAPVEQHEHDGGLSEHEEQDELHDELHNAQPLSLYATSPAVAIPKFRDRERDPESPAPSRAKFEPNMVGSYKGKPLTMPIMRNPEILAQLDSAQPVNEVVGSVHHRGPTDEFNPTSVQNNTEAIVFSAPRSFSERLMIEDMMEAAKARSAESQGAPTVQGQ